MSRRVSLVECFSEVVDPRDPRWVFHELTDILALAVIAGAEGWEDIEEFGKQKRDWLKKFLRLPNGVPSHDTISRDQAAGVSKGVYAVDRVAPRRPGPEAGGHRWQDAAP